MADCASFSAGVVSVEKLRLVQSVTLKRIRCGGVQVLNGVSLEVAPGSITSVIGRNGTGKSSGFSPQLPEHR